MKVVVCGSTYWNSQEEFDAKYEGRCLEAVDSVSKTPAYYLIPEYHGKFGLRWWKERIDTWFSPDITCLICGTWSDPKFSRFGDSVVVLNGGADHDRPHSNHWNYMGCAFTALFAYLCNRRDWDLLIWCEPDFLLGNVNWRSVFDEFLRRPEEVMGPAWFHRSSDLLGWKPSAVRRFLHSRLRPNLSTDTKLMWIDDELDKMFHKVWWNPWPQIKTVRYDYGHAATEKGPVEDTLKWPYIRLPHPSIIERYERECTSKAVPLR